MGADMRDEAGKGVGGAGEREQGGAGGEVCVQKKNEGEGKLCVRAFFFLRHDVCWKVLRRSWPVLIMA